LMPTFALSVWSVEREDAHFFVVLLVVWQEINSERGSHTRMTGGSEHWHLHALLAGLALLSLAHLAAAGAVTYMVPMRDGVRLATNVYLPTGQGPWPTVLSRTPYGRFRIDELTSRGYAVVTQDWRGYFGSEGVKTPFETDGWGDLQDGYDTVEWIAGQNWSNGNVGTWGGSALGITQNLMAGSYPPHLVCQYILAGASDLYSQMVFQGGVLLKSMVESWWADWGTPQHLADLLSHPNYDSRWALMNSDIRVGGMSYPALHVGGWYDIFLQGTINAFVERQHNGGPGSKGNQKLVMGPWWHGGFGTTTQGQLTFPANSLYTEMWPDTFRLYDYWLKGVDNGYTALPTVRYYVMGDVDDPSAPGNEWRSADDWPIKHTNMSLYLSEERLSDRLWTSGTRSYLYDPKNPVPTAGGANLVLASGPMDQGNVEERKDVLVFTSKTLDFPVEVTGRVFVELYASSSCPDTDFMAKLTDVYPDGRSMLVLDGAIRARHRNSMESEDFMEPGNVYRFTIDLWSTSIVFNKGHRIRVDITSSNYPRFDANPNTGHPFRADAETRVANNSVWFGESYPSRIILPLAGPDTDGDGMYDIFDPFPYRAGLLPTLEDMGKAIQSADVLIASVKDVKLRSTLQEGAALARARLAEGDLVGAGHLIDTLEACLAFDPYAVTLPEARTLVDAALDEATSALRDNRLLDTLESVRAAWLMGILRASFHGVRTGPLLGYLSEALDLLSAGRGPDAVRLLLWMNRTDVKSLAARIQLAKEAGASPSDLSLIESMMDSAKDRLLLREFAGSESMLSTVDRRLAGLGFPVGEPWAIVFLLIALFAYDRGRPRGHHGQGLR